MALRSRLRSALRSVLTAVKDGDKAAADAVYKQAVPEIDKMVVRQVM